MDNRKAIPDPGQMVRVLTRTYLIKVCLENARAMSFVLCTSMRTLRGCSGILNFTSRSLIRMSGRVLVVKPTDSPGFCAFPHPPEELCDRDQAAPLRLQRLMRRRRAFRGRICCCKQFLAEISQGLKTKDEHTDLYL